MSQNQEIKNPAPFSLEIVVNNSETKERIKLIENMVESANKSISEINVISALELLKNPYSLSFFKAFVPENCFNVYSVFADVISSIDLDTEKYLNSIVVEYNGNIVFCESGKHVQFRKKRKIGETEEAKIESSIIVKNGTASSSSSSSSSSSTVINTQSDNIEINRGENIIYYITEQFLKIYNQLSIPDEFVKFYIDTAVKNIKIHKPSLYYDTREDILLNIGKVLSRMSMLDNKQYYRTHINELYDQLEYFGNLINTNDSYQTIFILMELYEIWHVIQPYDLDKVDDPSYPFYRRALIPMREKSYRKRIGEIAAKYSIPRHFVNAIKDSDNLEQILDLVTFTINASVVVNKKLPSDFTFINYTYVLRDMQKILTEKMKKFTEISIDSISHSIIKMLRRLVVTNMSMYLGWLTQKTLNDYSVKFGKENWLEYLSDSKKYDKNLAARELNYQKTIASMKLSIKNLNANVKNLNSSLVATHEREMILVRQNAYITEINQYQSRQIEEMKRKYLAMVKQMKKQDEQIKLLRDKVFSCQECSKIDKELLETKDDAQKLPRRLLPEEISFTNQYLSVDGNTDNNSLCMEYLHEEHDTESEFVFGPVIPLHEPTTPNMPNAQNKFNIDAALDNISGLLHPSETLPAQEELFDFSKNENLLT